MSGIRLTTARYFTPAGISIQGKGITPDIIIEQGKFESYNYKRYSESDLNESLDKEKNDNDNEKDKSEKTIDKDDRLSRDYQLKRAIDLAKAISVSRKISESN